MRSEVGQAFDEARVEVAGIAAEVLPDKCQLIVKQAVGKRTYSNVPCKLKGGSGDVDGASYRIRFAWGSPAIVGTDVVLDPIAGRPQLTLQLVEPADSSTGIWQEWRATSGPAFGRVDVGL